MWSVKSGVRFSLYTFSFNIFFYFLFFSFIALQMYNSAMQLYQRTRRLRFIKFLTR